MRGQGFLYAESSLQPTVSHSTEEAEFRAAGKGVCLFRTARNILEETGYLQPATPMDQDNQACLSAGTSATCSNKLRHIRNDHHTLREGYAEGAVDPRYCPTVDMVADISTFSVTLSAFTMDCQLFPLQLPMIRWLRGVS